jgi:subtilisin family serine protease
MVRSVLAAFVVPYAVLGARVRRSSSGVSAHAETTLISSVPVLNYHKAKTGQQEWIVLFDEGTKQAALEEFCGKQGHCQQMGHPEAGGVPFVEIRAAEADLGAQFDLAEKSGLKVKFAEPNAMEPLIGIGDVIYAEDEDPVTIANDARRWGVRRVGGDTAPTKGKGVHMYVVDSGVRTTHRDFGGRAITTVDAAGDSLVECRGDRNCAQDTNGHGTHCAAIAGGSTRGIATECYVHAVKIAFDGETTWSKTIAAFDWIAGLGQRPAVVTASIGGSGTWNSVQVASDALVMAGITVLTSAGNHGDDACGYTPANVPSVISVGATTPADRPAGFSNFGSCVDIWAPGQGIWAASHSSDRGEMSRGGTSMACPAVAGAVAILLEENPSMNPAQLRQTLVDRALVDFIPQMKADDDSNLMAWVGTGEVPPQGSLEPCRRRRRILCFD